VLGQVHSVLVLLVLVFLLGVYKTLVSMVIIDEPIGAKEIIDELIGTALEAGIGPLAVYVFIGSQWNYDTEIKIIGFTRRRGDQSKEDASIHTPYGG
jgi:hypothetical protein